MTSGFPAATNRRLNDRISGGFWLDLGEDVTETLEVIPPVEGDPVRPREIHLSGCEPITQPPALFHPIARGWAGAGLLAMVLYGMYELHLPLV